MAEILSTGFVPISAVPVPSEVTSGESLTLHIELNPVPTASTTLYVSFEVLAGTGSPFQVFPEPVAVEAGENEVFVVLVTTASLTSEMAVLLTVSDMDGKHAECELLIHV